MAYVSVTGNAGNSGVKKWEYACAVEWMLNELAGKRLTSRLEVNVRLVPGLKAKDGCKGDCTWEDDNLRPREFTVRLDTEMPRQTQFKILAHELTHVKQYARGELFDTCRLDKIRWKRRMYAYPDKVSNRVYMKWPWEVEARKMEQVLYKKWVNRSE